MATKFMNGVDLQSQKITNLATPTTSTDGVNKQYVDNAVLGVIAKSSVAAASVGNLTLSGTQTVDGVALIAGNRVLVKNQTTASQNSVYVVAAGAWTVAADFAQGYIANGDFLQVESGTTNGAKSFNVTTLDPISVGTTSITFSPYGAGIAYTAGNGVALTGASFSANADGTSLISDGTSLRVNPAYSGLAKRFASDVPAATAATQITMAHGLGTGDLVSITVKEASTKAIVYPDVTFDATNIYLTFAAAITLAQFRVTAAI